MSRCPARETCIDGSYPSDERCIRKKGHAPPHHCPHGFHWTDTPEDFTGVCGACGQNVVLRMDPVVAIKRAAKLTRPPRARR